jgi:hypothetical protein
MNKRYIRIHIHLINKTKSYRTELKKKAKKDDDRMLYPEPARRGHEIVHIAVSTAKFLPDVRRDWTDGVKP